MRSDAMCTRLGRRSAARHPCLRASGPRSSPKASRSRFGVGLLLAAALAVTTVAGAAGTSTPACSLVLGAGNLAGPYVVGSRLAGPGAFAEDPLATAAGAASRLAGFGSEGECRVELVRPVTATGLQEGPLEIESSATVYRDQAGARAAFGYAVRSLVPATYAGLPVDFPLGDRAREWVRQDASTYGTMLAASP